MKNMEAPPALNSGFLSTASGQAARVILGTAQRN